ncbi:MAG: hypothetical protein ACM3ZO_01000 [Clostridia bacterium]
MAVKVDLEVIDAFCPRLFRVLDNLGLLPRTLLAKPNEFEKYPRLLFGSIQRYNNVDAGFKEWESRILREALGKNDYYPDVQELRQWMLAHSETFAKRANLQHLSTSLYARLFQYLYPRRVLANAYCLKHRGEQSVLDTFKRLVNAQDLETKRNAQADLEALLDTDLVQSTDSPISKLKTAYEDEWETVVDDAKQSLMAGAHYYCKVLSGTEKLVPAEPEAEDEQQAELYENREEEDE